MYSFFFSFVRHKSLCTLYCLCICVGGGILEAIRGWWPGAVGNCLAIAKKTSCQDNARSKPESIQQPLSMPHDQSPV